MSKLLLLVQVPRSGRGRSYVGHGFRAPDPENRRAGQHDAHWGAPDSHVQRHFPQGDPNTRQVNASCGSTKGNAECNFVFKFVKRLLIMLRNKKGPRSGTPPFHISKYCLFSR